MLVAVFLVPHHNHGAELEAETFGSHQMAVGIDNTFQKRVELLC